VSEPLVTRASRFAVRALLKPVLHPAVPIPLQRAWVSLATRTLRVPRGVRFETVQLGAVSAERVTHGHNRATPRTAVLFFHGGGYILGSPRTHRSIAGRIALLSGAVAYVPRYRLAPEHPFPAALEDAVAAYRALMARDDAPRRVVVAGDSAGGGLALALALRVRDAGLAQPRGLALVSPWVDLTCSRLGDARGDPLLRASWLRQAAAGYLRGHRPDEPLASPIHADLSGLPPTLIQCGTAEMVREDSRRLSDAMRAAGVSAELDEHAGMWHDFQLYAGIVPEATAAVRGLSSAISAWLA